jgi:AraC family transcriptional regulator of adaptative response / DNA-3-methyladenine glycosylase II
MVDSNGGRPSPAELLSRAERWRPWRAYAALHLWAAGVPHPAPPEKIDEREAA